VSAIAGAARTGTTARTAAEFAPTSTSIASGVTASGGTSRRRNSADVPGRHHARCLPQGVRWPDGEDEVRHAISYLHEYTVPVHWAV